MAKFEDFVKKAEGRYKETSPYKMELEDTVYEIASPDAVQMLELSELDDHQMLAQLKVIFRKNPAAWGALVRELEGQDASVLQVIVEDMFSHWNQEGVTAGKLKKSAKS